ncbi:MAG: methyltransferase domain-containing protein [Planctomycetes bacterium]|nr:methyltransferase domain-containing protein [Planctomycetota bacterium]
MPAAKKEPPPWYVEAFSRAYLDVYAHRHNETSERAEALGALALLRHAPGDGRLLDLAAGAGRHARHLKQAGCRVTCLDLSADLLLAASRAGLSCVRGDLRALPFRDGAFAAIACLFSSFGYFADDRENARVLTEAARVLRPGGRALFDLMDPRTVRQTLRARDRIEREGTVIEIERRLTPDDRRVEKSVRLTRPGEPMRTWTESVRLFTRDEFAALALRAGLEIEATYGDFDGHPHESGRTRMLILGTDTNF